MFDLKKIKASLQLSVLGVTGVPESSKPEVTGGLPNISKNTPPVSPVWRGVSRPESGTPDTPEQTERCSPITDGKSLSDRAFESLAHREHPEHPVKDKVYSQTTVDKTVRYLGQFLNVPVEVLLDRYFTQADLNDIANGMYDGKLTALVELIQTDSEFPFTGLNNCQTGNHYAKSD